MIDRKNLEDAILIVTTGKDSQGRSYNDLGRLNQAAWLGERMPYVLKELDDCAFLLRKAAQTFHNYSKIHDAKGTYEGHRKAMENLGRAREIDAHLDARPIFKKVTFVCAHCQKTQEGKFYQHETGNWQTPGLYPTHEFCSKECADAFHRPKKVTNTN